MRVGKFVEHFRAAAVAADAKSMDPVVRYCAMGRQLGYAGYMLLDNVCVVSTCESDGRVGLVGGKWGSMGGLRIPC